LLSSDYYISKSKIYTQALSFGFTNLFY